MGYSRANEMLVSAVILSFDRYCLDTLTLLLMVPAFIRLWYSSWAASLRPRR